jgi:hypothetical protein
MGAPDAVRHHRHERPGLRDWLYLEAGLNPSEVDAVERMLTRSEIRQDSFKSLTGQNDPKKFIHRLRRKLARYGIAVSTRGGVRGNPARYYLSREHKDKLRALVR